MAEQIGARHQTLQRLRRLSRRRAARSAEGAYVIDGPTLLAEALDAGVTVTDVVAEPGCPPDLFDRAALAGASVWRGRAGSLGGVVGDGEPPRVAGRPRQERR